MKKWILTLALVASSALAVEKPVPGKPNPDAQEKPSPRDVREATVSSKEDSPARKAAQALDGKALVGEAVALDDTLKLLNKLKNFGGKVSGGTAAPLKKEIAAVLAGDEGYRAEAFGCDKLNPLTDKDGRIQIMECTLHYTRVTREQDTRIEVHFGTDGWQTATAKIKDVDYRIAD